MISNMLQKTYVCLLEGVRSPSFNLFKKKKNWHVFKRTPKD